MLSGRPLRHGAGLPFGLLALVAACSSGPADKQALVSAGAKSSSPVTTAITAAQVADATITGVFPVPFTFADGAYEGAPLVPGSAVSPMAVLMTRLVRLGELDDHAGEDAAALIASNEGGSGERISLAVVGVRDGKAVSLATTLIGDRTKVRDLRLAGRDIVLDIIEIGQGEPGCCGTQLATRTYRLDGADLKLRSSQVTGRKSLDMTVAGHTWTAVALDRAPLDPKVTAPTLTFSGGRVAGSSGCNQYTAAITEPKPGTIAVGPTAGTRRACIGPAAEVEAHFLKNLAASTSYTFLAGQLVLSGVQGEQMRTITFSPAPPSPDNRTGGQDGAR